MILALAALALAWWVLGTRSQEHEIRAGFSSAVSLAEGLDVRVDGIDAGKVTSVDYENGQAVVGIGIEDEDVWPLHRGSRAIIRWGTTAGNGTRFVELEPGPRSAPELPDGGIIPSEETVSPVEFDDVFNTFDADTRARMQSMLGRSADTFGGREAELRQGLERTPPALDATSGVFRELADDEHAIQRLVAHTAATTRTLAAQDPQIRQLVDGAAASFDELGRHAHDVQTDIEQFPQALTESRATLQRLDASVDELDGLVADLAPGAKALRPLAADARPALAELRRTVPAGLATIRTARASAPAITSLLRRATPFAEDLRPLLGDLAPKLDCIRPYAPELAGFLSNWTSFTKNHDDTSHYARVRGNVGLEANASTLPQTSKAFVDLNGATYAFPRPPGFGSGEPWFIEECGYGPDAVDPSKDPEDD